MTRRKTILAAGVACAACCATLIWPFVAAAGLGGTGSLFAGSLFGLGMAELACLAALVVGAVVLTYAAYRWQRGKVKLSATDGPTCELGSACDPASNKRMTS